jgi:hypothetical protein
VALTRFKRTLYWSRTWVRELTHTLHLPPAHAEIYGGPHYEWLRDCLERLPRLQSLVVEGLPFFDHASLLTLRHSSIWWQQTHPNIYPVFGLRLLDASRCSNVTSNGLAEALSHFPDLVSLDLSKTLAAKDATVLDKLKHLRNLRVLKLRGLGLKDPDLSIVASAIDVRVRSLDVSDNQLTDASARMLLDYCLKEASTQSHARRSPLPPIQHGRPAGEVDTFATENLDRHMRQKLTNGFVGSLAIEEARDIGITHLYLSNNNISVEGISGLLRSARLQVLDVGTLPVIARNSRPSQSDNEKIELSLPGVEKLTPILSEFASQRLMHLRINYTIVTKNCPVDAVASLRAELNGDYDIYAPVDAQELAALQRPQPELDSLDNAVYELPGDLVLPTELPTASPGPSDTSCSNNNNDVVKPKELAQSPVIRATPDLPKIKRGSIYAPEPVDIPDSALALARPTYEARGGLTPKSAFSDVREKISLTSDESIQKSTRSRHNSIQFVEERRARLDLRQSQENRLHPGMLPKIHTLILTDVPSTTDNEELIERLVQFIGDCAEEVQIAKLRAKHTYMLPPGRSRHIAEREYVKSLFALNRIVLEMEPPQVAPRKVTTSWRTYPTKSSTEDTDSETFWEAATQDFSFFGDEECGLPTAEPGRGPPLAAMSGLMLAPKRPAAPPKPRQPDPDVKPVLDVVSEMGKFRKEKKAAYNVALQSGDPDPFVEGYWPGDITVVRKPHDADAGSLDYYGNKYESGWFYR